MREKSWCFPSPYGVVGWVKHGSPFQFAEVLQSMVVEEETRSLLDGHTKRERTL